MSVVVTNELKGISSCNTFEDGCVQECRLDEYNEVETKYGVFVPRFSRPDMRRKDTRSLAFYKNGQIKSLSLEEQTPIETPLGTMPAELITFHEDGHLDSIFPLNGEIGFGWSEEEEASLAKEYTFDFPFGQFTAKIIGARFYQNEQVRSVILWPGEVVIIDTIFGKMPVRIGFKLYEALSLQSIEPAEPVWIQTPIGEVKIFNPLAYGIDADCNSLCFRLDGSLHSFVTTGTIWITDFLTNQKEKFSSRLRPGLTDEDVYFTPIKVTFFENTVCIEEEKEKKEYPIDTCSFEFQFFDSFTAKRMCYGECSSCGGGCS